MGIIVISEGIFISNYMMYFKACWDGLPAIVFWDSPKIERYENKKRKTTEDYKI